MKLLTAIFIVAASTANAQSVESDSHSASNSGVVFGDSYATQQAPSAIAPGIMHTAPCIVGSSAGIGVPGIGLSGGNGRLEKECNTREEIKALNILLSQPPSLARKASILHYCNNDESIRKTLVQMGVCKVSKPMKVAHKKPKKNVREIYTAHFKICQDLGGRRIGIYPNTQKAIDSCRDYIRKNPGANVNLTK